MTCGGVCQGAASAQRRRRPARRLFLRKDRRRHHRDRGPQVADVRASGFAPSRVRSPHASIPGDFGARERRCSKADRACPTPDRQVSIRKRRRRRFDSRFARRLLAPAAARATVDGRDRRHREVPATVARRPRCARCARRPASLLCLRARHGRRRPAGPTACALPSALLHVTFDRDLPCSIRRTLRGSARTTLTGGAGGFLVASFMSRPSAQRSITDLG